MPDKRFHADETPGFDASPEALVYLIDTNVVSELSKSDPNANVVRWLGRHEPYLRVSAVTIGELEFGYRLQPAGQKRERLRKWLDQICQTMRDNVLPLDAAVAAAWGDLEGSLAERRLRLSTTDAMIAATALHHRLVLVTRDASFAKVGLETLNPWTR